MKTVEKIDTLEIALACASRGWPVIPTCWPDSKGDCGCGRPRKHVPQEVGKAPLTGEGFRLASTDPEKIRAWWLRWPGANVSINLKLAGLVAVDADSPQAVKEVESLGMQTTMKRNSRSPAWLFRWSEGCPVTRTAHQGRSRAIDILSEGMLAVAGRHRLGFDIYLEDLDCHLPFPPEWAVQLLKDSSKKGTLVVGEVPDYLPEVVLEDLQLPKRLQQLIVDPSSFDYPSSSEAEFAALTGLIRQGQPDDVIWAIFMDSRYPISQKPIRKGQKWFSKELSRANSMVYPTNQQMTEVTTRIWGWMQGQDWSGKDGATDWHVLIEESVRPTLRPRTFERYEGIVRNHLVPSIGRRTLHRLSPQDVQSLYISKLSTLSARSVEHIHAVLRRALGQALKFGLVNRNVATLVDVPRPTRKEARPFSSDEARMLLAAIPEHRMEALYILCLAMGLRQGEALGLKWEDVDLDAGTLQIRRALQRIEGEYRVVEPKSSRSRRTLALPEIAAVALWERHTRQEEEKTQSNGDWEDWGLVFTTRRGRPLNRHNVTKEFQSLLEQVGLPRQRFHDLRHTCASLLLAQNVQPRDVMEVLGHSQIGLTMDTYSHVMPPALRNAATRMDDILAA